MSVTVVAPNAVMIFDQFGKKYSKYPKDKFRRNMYYIRSQGYATVWNTNNQTIIKITKKGRKKFLNYKIKDLKIKKPEIWDKKWRIVIADIPEKKKVARNVLRSTLKRIGFYQLQKSVWAHPYECENEIEYLKEIYELRLYLYYIVADKIKQDYKLIKHFNL